jgi:ribose transport system ATP-binding protein
MQDHAGVVRVAVRNLSKTFPGTRALAEVDLDVRAGEIHALVGGNGSGKSTLIKILMGIYQGDAGGELQFGDEVTPATDSTPELALAAGIYAVHQDLGIFPDLSVAENIALGFGYETSAGRISWPKLRARTQGLIERFEIDAKPDTPLRSLRQGVRTQVAIARALQAESSSRGLLILDEPTASLPAHEVRLLLDTLRRYASRGQAILYVSHRLDEVLSLADRITVLRDGIRVGTYDADTLDETRLIELIVGRDVDRVFPPMPEVTLTETVLSVRNVAVGPLRDVSLEIVRGEVVGIAGLLGSGRSELLRAIFGDLELLAGEMRLAGTPYSPRRPADAMQEDIAYVPENRATDAVFPDLSIADNIAMTNVSSYFTRLHLGKRRMRADARRLMTEFLVKAPADDVPLATLSGGNQQKVVLARWLRRQPRLLLLDEPTQGVDVGARAEIYGLVRAAVAAGAAAILVASDFEELAHICDRVLVVRDGCIASEVRRGELSAERLTQMIYDRAGA